MITKHQDACAGAVVPIPLPTAGTDEISFRSPVPVRLQLTGIIRQGYASGEYPAHEPERADHAIRDRPGNCPRRCCHFPDGRLPSAGKSSQRLGEVED